MPPPLASSDTARIAQIGRGTSFLCWQEFGADDLSLRPDAALTEKEKGFHLPSGMQVKETHVSSFAVAESSSVKPSKEVDSALPVVLLQ